MNYFLTIVVAIASAVSVYGQSDAAPYAEAYLESRHLVPGEQSILWLRVHGGQPDGRPQAPEVKGAAINFIQAVTRINSDRRLTQVYAYRVSAPHPGKYVIPSIAMSSKGKRLLTDPLVFQVHPESVLQSIATGNRDNDVKIGWFPAKTTLYQSEVCPVVLKVYSPARMRVVSFGLPDPQKINCLAWRFSLPNPRQTNTVAIDGTTYRVVRYATTLSGIAAGKATLGPTKLRLIIRERIIDPQLGPRLVDKPIPLVLPELDFKILPLPAGAPDHFDGAVGSFQITAQCQKVSLKETDSTEVILHVEGTGNLPTLKAPHLSGDSWKIIDTSKVTRGEERRYTSGRVTFRQLLRPNSSAVTTIPPYQFCYFDPGDESYKNLQTSPISVKISPVAASANNFAAKTPQNHHDTPPERMQDIVGFINQPKPHDARFKLHRSPVFHLVPVVLAITIVALALRRRHRRKMLMNPEANEKKRALKQLTEAPDTHSFYRQAGHIIDRWHHGGIGQKQLQDILSERDSICFQPEGNPHEAISPERKKSIISILRRSTQLITFVALISLATEPSSAKDGNSPATRATDDPPALTAPDSAGNSARDAWKTGDYQQALSIYQQQYPDPEKTSADVMFNIGNCHYRLDQPGLAALAWRRALLNEPTHHQARQNLRFVELQQNASVPKTYPWQTRLAMLDSDTYRAVLYTCGWVMLLATLAMFLFWKNKTLLVTTIISVCLAGAITGAAIFALVYYPDGYSTGPPEKQAVVLSQTPLYDEAHRLSNENDADAEGNPSLNPASLVIVNARRGPWMHVTTVDQEEGWVETKHLAVVVDKAPGN